MGLSRSKLFVVYGGQWGSEGKGQVLAAMANESAGMQFINVRVGGPNAGHTVTAMDGRIVKAQQIPVCAFVHQRAQAVLGCSAVLLPAVFTAELEQLCEIWQPDSPSPVLVDRQAIVITDEMLAAETELKTRIGSTGEGVGAATSAKVMRVGVPFNQWIDTYEAGRVFWARWSKHLQMADTVRHLTRHAQHSIPTDVYLEGTQGYQLSLNTSGYYPYCTSRDCGPEALMAQVGVSTRAYRQSEIVCVLRTYPIRVGGNSGPLPKEITWDDLKERTNGYVATPERTTVTKKIRRIAEWDDDVVWRTILETRPTLLAITFLDYVFPEVANTRYADDLPEHALQWLSGIQTRFGVPVRYVSTGAGQQHTLRVYV